MNSRDLITRKLSMSWDTSLSSVLSSLVNIHVSISSQPTYEVLSSKRLQGTFARIQPTKKIQNWGFVRNGRVFSTLIIDREAALTHCFKFRRQNWDQAGVWIVLRRFWKIWDTVFATTGIFPTSFGTFFDALTWRRGAQLVKNQVLKKKKTTSIFWLKSYFCRNCEYFM